ncbi:unnamed protein product [Phaeothamnion confervicola]
MSYTGGDSGRSHSGAGARTSGGGGRADDTMQGATPRDGGDSRISGDGGYESRFQASAAAAVATDAAAQAGANMLLLLPQQQALPPPSDAMELGTPRERHPGGDERGAAAAMANLTAMAASAAHVQAPREPRKRGVPLAGGGGASTGAGAGIDDGSDGDASYWSDGSEGDVKSSGGRGKRMRIESLIHRDEG